MKVARKTGGNGVLKEIIVASDLEITSVIRDSGWRAVGCGGQFRCRRGARSFSLFSSSLLSPLLFRYVTWWRPSLIEVVLWCSHAFAASLDFNHYSNDALMTDHNAMTSRTPRLILPLAPTVAA